MRRQINMHNYQAWFIDYNEGLLTPEEMLLLLTFIDNNPQIKNEFKDYDALALEAPDTGFALKSKLLKTAEEDDTEQKSTLESLALAYIDGNLTSPQKDALTTQLENASLTEEDLLLMQQTKLQPPATLFDSKESLYNLTIYDGNVDEWIIAGIEGLLNSVEAAALASFLQTHPEYKLVEDAYRQTILQRQAVTFEKKILYRSTITAENAEKNIIAHVEGLLPANDIHNLEIFLANNPPYAHMLSVYRQTKLPADGTVSFPGKAALRKAVPFIRVSHLYKIAAIAACLILIWGMNHLLTERDDTKVAQYKTRIETKDNTGNKILPVAGEKSDNSLTIVPHREGNKSKHNPSLTHMSGTKKTYRKSLHKKNETILAAAPNRNDSAATHLQELANNTVNVVDTANHTVTATTDSVNKHLAPNGNEFLNPIVTGTLNETAQSSKTKTMNLKQYFQDFINKKGAVTVPDEPAEVYATYSGKRKITDAVVWAIAKVTGERLKIATTYNADDKLSTIKLGSN